MTNSTMQDTRSIRGYAPYSITKGGEVINRNTGHVIAVKDYDHFSGRVNLTVTRNGEKVRVTQNIERLYNLAWGKDAYMEMTV